MKSKSFHKKLTASYIYLLAAVAAIMLLGFVLTVWFSVLPSMRITMQSKPMSSATVWTSSAHTL